MNKKHDRQEKTNEEANCEGAASAQEAPEDIVETLKKSLAEAEDSRLRLLAEMDNQRKRMAKDMDSVRNLVMADTLFPFFQVFDHLSMAMSAANTSDNLKALITGIEMIQAEFGKAFEELGVARIDAVGKDFDPNIHEAISEEPSEDTPAGKILRQWSCGYKVGDRLLRAAKVVVSSGSETTVSES